MTTLIEQPLFNRRKHERFSLPPMYTGVTVRRSRGMTMHVLHGHAYDVSESGVRLELDEPLRSGELVQVTIDLPTKGGSVSAWAEVVRIYDAEDDPGARRVAMKFREFNTPADHTRLLSYIGVGSLRRAA